MLLYTTCKPFRGHDAVIQRNALRSWAQLPETRILIVGSDPGTGELAHEIGALWQPYSGVPLVRDLWQAARGVALPEETLAYCNADMILGPDFVEAGKAAAGWQREFLLVGQRHALQVYEELDLAQDWQGQLAGWFKSEGSLGVECMVDYFIWRGDFWGQIPDFIIGRYVWDDWLLWRALSAGVFVCDVTARVHAYHQGHHQLPWEHPEHLHNAGVAGHPGSGIKDVKWELVETGFRQKTR